MSDKTNFSMETDDFKKECRITDSIKSLASIHFMEFYFLLI